MSAEVAIPVPATPGAVSRAVDGPRWYPRARVCDIQSDARGVRWEVVRVEQGGRVLHWLSFERPERKARTEAAPTHPDYPSDEAVLEAARAARRERTRAR